jgi:WD40 repeat protein
MLDMDDIEGNLNKNPADWEPWSPSGDRFLIYNVDGMVKIFDAQTGEVLQTLSGHEGELIEDQDRRVEQAAWSPKGDLIAVSSTADNSVIVYQAESGEALYTLPGGFEADWVVFGTWSPSGDRLTTRGPGGAKVYETATGRLLLDLSIPQTICRRALWSPDGARILTLEYFESATVWDAESGEELLRITDIINPQSVDWSPSGDLFAVSGSEGFVHVWDVINKKEFAKISGTLGWAEHLTFSPDGERILAAGEDNKLNILDLTETSLSIPMPMCGWISIAAWSPDGDQITFGSPCPPDYLVNIWDANSGEQLFAIRGNDFSPGKTVAWSPSGDRILSVTEDNAAWVWDASNGEPLQNFLGHDINIWVVSWSPDGNQIATADESGKVIVWDSNSGEELLKFSGHKYPVRSVTWSPDGSSILSTGEESEAMIWEAETGQVLLDQFYENINTVVSFGAWTKDGERVILLSADGFVRIFDSETSVLLSQFLTPSGMSPSAFSLSPTEERMIIRSADGVARVWNIATGTEVLSYDIGGIIDPVYSPDGTRVAIGNLEADWANLQVFPTWQSLEELIEHAKECCVVRELTPGEREVFGLPSR